MLRRGIIDQTRLFPSPQAPSGSHHLISFLDYCHNRPHITLLTVTLTQRIKAPRNIPSPPTHIMKPRFGWLYADASFFPLICPYNTMNIIQSYHIPPKIQRLASCWLRDTGIGIERAHASPFTVSDSPRKQQPISRVSSGFLWICATRRFGFVDGMFCCDSRLCETVSLLQDGRERRRKFTRTLGKAIRPCLAVREGVGSLGCGLANQPASGRFYE